MANDFKKSVHETGYSHEELYFHNLNKKLLESIRKSAQTNQQEITHEESKDSQGTNENRKAA